MPTAEGGWTHRHACGSSAMSVIPGWHSSSSSEANSWRATGRCPWPAAAITTPLPDRCTAPPWSPYCTRVGYGHRPCACWGYTTCGGGFVGYVAQLAEGGGDGGRQHGDTDDPLLLHESVWHLPGIIGARSRWVLSTAGRRRPLCWTYAPWLTGWRGYYGKKMSWIFYHLKVLNESCIIETATRIVYMHTRLHELYILSTWCCSNFVLRYFCSWQPCSHYVESNIGESS